MSIGLACACGEPFLDVGPDGARCRRRHFTPRDGGGRLNGKAGNLLVLPAAEVPLVATPARFPLLSAVDILKIEAPPDLVAGMVPSAGIVVVSGDFGSFKSFAMLDLLACIAGGWDWAGRPVRQGRVVYAFGEGATGLKKRVRAWQIARGLLFPSSPDFTFIPAVPHALDPLDIASFVAALGPINEGVAAVAIDTLSLTIPGAQENDSATMTRAVALADAIRRATGGATVFLIHHVGKMGDSARGHSSLLGNADAELKFSRSEGSDVVTISCGKVKDQAAFEPFELRRRVVELGSIDAHGAPETSLVLDVDQSSAPTKLTDAGLRVGDLLRETFGFGGATASQWEAVAIEAKVSRASYFRAKTALIAAGLVIQVGDGRRGTRFHHADCVKSQGLTEVSNGLTTLTEMSVSQSHHLLSGETVRLSDDDTDDPDELPWPPATAGAGSDVETRYPL